MNGSLNYEILGEMPEWNLEDFYSGPEADEIDQDIHACMSAAKAFQSMYMGKLASLPPDIFGKAIIEYENWSILIGKISSYAQLYYAANISDPERGRFVQTIRERLTEISSFFLFFTLELNRLDDAVLDEKLRDSTVEHYRPWLRNLRMFRSYQLSDEIEQLLMERDVVGSEAWQRLFVETMAGLRFPFAGEQLTSAQILHFMSDHDAKKREEAAKSLGQVLGQNVSIFSLIINTLIKDKEIEDKWRGYPASTSYRNLSNHVDDAIVDALAETVSKNYSRLSHRYYSLKAKWFGVDRLDYWDRNAPLPNHDNRIIKWPEAQKIVLDAYRAFSPELADIGCQFFEKGWIDAPARPGKSSGAFAHPSVPSVHPWLLLNFQGRVRDVMTLAHELGHGIHQVLAADKGYFLSSVPLTLAETASVFGEMLTFRALLADENDLLLRRSMLASKVEDALNTVVRQIAFYQFEKKLHLERRSGEISAGRIGEIWMETQKESLGPSLRFDDSYQYFWAYISHFVQSPFYVYAYAFGDCLVNSLYGLYQKGESGFEEKYRKMLEAGGTLEHKELLAPFGINISDPSFWQNGLDVISGFIDMLETMEN